MHFNLQDEQLRWPAAKCFKQAWTKMRSSHDVQQLGTPPLPRDIQTLKGILIY